MENIEGPTTSAADLAQDLGLSPRSVWGWRRRRLRATLSDRGVQVAIAMYLLGVLMGAGLR